MSGGHGALCWLNSTRDYAYMRRVTNNNYSHFLRDIIWRSVLRDWPTRPVRLERWITDRDPTFFMALEQGSQLQFELAPEPSKLFEWDSCTDICGAKSVITRHTLTVFAMISCQIVSPSYLVLTSFLYAYRRNTLSRTVRRFVTLGSSFRPHASRTGGERSQNLAHRVVEQRETTLDAQYLTNVKCSTRSHVSSSEKLLVSAGRLNSWRLPEQI